jgi:hypothetical protein
MTQTFQPEPFDLDKITWREKDVLKTLKTIMTLEHRTTFTADDLGKYGFDRYFPKSKDGKAHGKGAFCAKHLRGGTIQEMGWTRSKADGNRDRKIRVYAFVEKEEMPK